MKEDPRVYDVCIIGAGVVGCAIARELSRFSVSILVLEKESDVACGATKANSGIVHGGYSARHGTLKAALCRPGNRMFARMESELAFGYRQTGSLVLAFDAEGKNRLRELADNGRRNGVHDLEILSPPQLSEREPRVSGEVVEALYCPSAGLASPYEFAIALAENAARNGVIFSLEAEVIGISKTGCFEISTSSGDPSNEGPFRARYVVNAAGLYSDRISAMLIEPGFSIVSRQGQYIVFEKGYGDLVKAVIFQTPTAKGKGILVTPTYHRNLMIGPQAEETGDRTNVDTTMEALSDIHARAEKSVPGIDLSRAITTFAGARATSTKKDFIIEETEVQGFFQAAGIDSPGLTSSPAIAERMRDLLADAGLELRPRSDFDPHREPVIVPKELTDEEVKSLLDAASPDRIVCRCERVTHGEITDAMARGLRVSSLDAVKRRTRAGMGRCQGGFCRPRVAEILSEHLHLSAAEVVRRHEEESARKTRVKAHLLKLRDGG